MSERARRWWRGRQRCLVCCRQRRFHLDWFHGPILATYDDFMRVVRAPSDTTAGQDDA